MTNQQIIAQQSKVINIQFDFNLNTTLSALFCSFLFWCRPLHYPFLWLVTADNTETESESQLSLSLPPAAASDSDSSRTFRKEHCTPGKIGKPGGHPSRMATRNTVHHCNLAFQDQDPHKPKGRREEMVNFPLVMQETVLGSVFIHEHRSDRQQIPRLFSLFVLESERPRIPQPSAQTRDLLQLSHALYVHTPSLENPHFVWRREWDHPLIIASDVSRKRTRRSNLGSEFVPHTAPPHLQDWKWSNILLHRIKTVLMAYTNTEQCMLVYGIWCLSPI